MKMVTIILIILASCSTMRIEVPSNLVVEKWLLIELNNEKEQLIWTQVNNSKVLSIGRDGNITVRMAHKSFTGKVKIYKDNGMLFHDFIFDEGFNIRDGKLPEFIQMLKQVTIYKYELNMLYVYSKDKEVTMKFQRLR